MLHGQYNVTTQKPQQSFGQERPFGARFLLNQLSATIKFFS